MKKLFTSPTIPQKSFSERITEATEIFRLTVSSLQTISDEITTEMQDNGVKIAELKAKNIELALLQAKSNKQIKAIEQLFE